MDYQDLVLPCVIPLTSRKMPYHGLQGLLVSGNAWLMSQKHGIKTTIV